MSLSILFWLFRPAAIEEEEEEEDDEAAEELDAFQCLVVYHVAGGLGEDFLLDYLNSDHGGSDLLLL